MRILALDTSVAACSACLWEDGRVLSGDSMPMMHGHAEALIPLLARLRDEVGLDWDSLDRIGVTVGPGSFTGLRVGLATARALRLATGVPVAGVTATRAWAASLPDAVRATVGSILVAIDTRRGDMYAELFRASDLVSLAGPEVVAASDLGSFIQRAGVGSSVPLVCGDASGLVDPLVQAGTLLAGPAVPWPDPAVVAALAAGAVLQDGDDVPSALYVRPPDAAIPANGGQLRPGAPAP
ncbi:tRNA (adenosine(37)-N6)-threonylcarbamoyltransferase complex dimerization subunit type 1 TsaB [Haematospirillum sp. H1815]|uniref:tRNA (adenosine(37)-N6)-threonylcarbamoyltransferase complex dimerization subunit type 1 TsaB n=1 Tax=Haematospirillum sp. H1815 TaxID=2723108 RepID=UPI00143A08C0|nr:tRNA (adenosine(37)-N6)-threonylcarbamoyltransferase complex dimerization subunit type 1 TsaB [Haematospirillum sp. H1815]NKD77790.1 tRNA (adenosine(37)-N6)-threonylcarbamoyltransferase complex dimerization subunit type 1 TsaB [Haematospirillum sp. H1815]